MNKQTKSGAINGETIRDFCFHYVRIQEWRFFKRELQAYSKMLIQSYQIFNVYSIKSNEKKTNFVYKRNIVSCPGHTASCPKGGTRTCDLWK